MARPWCCRGPFAGDARDGLVLAVLVSLAVISERLDASRAILEARRAAGAPAVTSGTLTATWIVVMVLSLVAAVYVACRAYEEASRIGNGTEAEKRRLSRLRLLLRLTVATWALWHLLGVVIVAGNPGAHWLQTLVHFALIGLVLVTLGGVGRSVVGDVSATWKRASLVRVELLLLAFLFAAVFVLPFTAVQMVEILRTWADGSWTQAACGLAAALLLGAVCRGSANRTMFPSDAGASTGRARLSKRAAAGVYAAMIALAIVLYLLGAKMGAVVVGGAVLAGLLTKWAPPHGVGQPAKDRPIRRLFATLSVVALGTLLVGLVDAAFGSFMLPSRPESQDWLLVVFAVIVAALFGLLAGHAQRDASGLSLSRRWQGAAVAVAAAGAALLAALAPGSAATDLEALWALPLLAIAVALAFRAFGEDHAPELWAGAGVAVGTIVAVYVHPVDASRTVGAFAIVLLAMAAILLLLHAASHWTARRAPIWECDADPRKWRRRVPLLSLLLVWAVAASYFHAEHAHQARTVARDGRTPGTLTARVRGWLDDHIGDAKGGTLPMLMVGASGGGLKASYWTDLVLDCIAGDGAPSAKSDDECAPSPEASRRYGLLFLASGVSGGSVGIYHLVTHPQAVRDGKPWVDDATGREVLSPIAGWGLFHDLPRYMLGIATNTRDCTDEASCRLNADRSLVQEAAVARFSGDIAPPEGQGLLQSDAHGPLTIYNGALDGAVGRFLSSPVSLAPLRAQDPDCNGWPTGEPSAGSIDAYDVLSDDRDLPAVTAALLSARFPVIAPPGRVGDKSEPDEPNECRTPKPPLAPVRVRDGGYVENTGLLTITDLLPSIRRVIEAWKRDRHHTDLQVPIVVVSIDDDPAEIDAEPQLGERSGGALAVGKQAGPAYLSRLSRDRLSSCQYRDVTYLRISPKPHLGAHAVTGWVVSKTSREHDLGDALAEGQSAGDRVAILRGILDGGEPAEHCAVTPPGSLR